METHRIKLKYQQLFQKFGNRPEAVQWADKETQYKRFEILSSIVPPKERSKKGGAGRP